MLLPRAAHADSDLPDAPQPQNTATTSPAPPDEEQPKRILGVIPNFRAVSAGEAAPPPNPKQAFRIATLSSFDAPSVFFIGVTSLIAEGNNTHPALGKGPGGFYAYFWRGFADKTDGNYLVLFAYPALLHEDERYFAMGQGGFTRRALHSLGSIVVCRDYQGRNTFNASEILGRGTAQAISVAYYPSSDRTASEFSEKMAYALMRDALTNSVREFWPDIATHILHRHP